ncbi:MAG TPA: hypothetical protein VK181_02610 [Rhizobium sp.]|nr:hypothetical protein [Rhizobium sp.]
MTEKLKSWGMNINTWITLAGFLLTFVLGYGNLTAFQARIDTQIAEFKSQRATDVAEMKMKTSSLENSVNSLAIQDARQIEQINSILTYLQRIDRSLEALVEDKNRRTP